MLKNLLFKLKLARKRSFISTRFSKEELERLDKYSETIERFDNQIAYTLKTRDEDLVPFDAKIEECNKTIDKLLKKSKIVDMIEITEEIYGDGDHYPMTDSVPAYDMKINGKTFLFIDHPNQAYHFLARSTDINLPRNEKIAYMLDKDKKALRYAMDEIKKKYLEKGDIIINQNQVTGEYDIKTKIDLDINNTEELEIIREVLDVIHQECEIKKAEAGKAKIIARANLKTNEIEREKELEKAHSEPRIKALQAKEEYARLLNKIATNKEAEEQEQE